MPQFFSRLVVDNNQDEFSPEPSFWHDHELAVFNYNLSDEGQALNALVFKVRRNPKNLLAHLRRIYFCHQNRLSSQLYAALLDFLIVLQGKGQAICRRMIAGSRSQLNSQELLTLRKAVNDDHARLGNRFSLFTSGLVGKSELVEYRHQSEEQHDFLALANDYIEYSQLDQAMEILETGINLSPDRQDLQEALLELYKSTGNEARFQTLHQSLAASGIPLVDGWRLTAIFFEGRSR